MRTIAIERSLLKAPPSLASLDDERQVLAATVNGFQNLTVRCQPKQELNLLRPPKLRLVGAGSLTSTFGRREGRYPGVSMKFVSNQPLNCAGSNTTRL